MGKYLKKGIGAFLGLILGSAVIVPVLLTTSAGATAVSYDPSKPAVEICKTFVNSTPALSVNLNAPFTFSISGDETVYTVDAGFCSAPINTTSGSVTITETNPAEWYSTTAIAETGPAGSTLTATSNDPATAAGTYNLGVEGSKGASVVVSASAGTVDTVQFTNTLDPGYVEVCKAATTGSGATGTYTFGLTGSDGFGTKPNSLVTASATIGAGAQCSAPVEVPAGSVNVVEQGTNLDVTGISATYNGSGNALTASNYIAGTSTITVNPSDTTTKGVGLTTNQTEVTYTDGVVGLKICKTWGYGDSPSSTTEYPFTVTPSATAAAGPVPAAYSFSLQAGQCTGTSTNPGGVALVDFRAGTTVTITEGITPGTKVESITTDGLGESIVPASLSTLNQTVQIVVGTPTSGSSATVPADEADVTFQNEAATPGLLKVCKIIGAMIPVTKVNNGAFTFTITSPSSPTVTETIQFALPLVAGTQLCGEIPNLPFNSTQTITETASAGNAVSAITINPGGSTNVNENVGGTATATGESVLVPGTTTSPNPNLMTGVASVVISEGGTPGGTTTEVDFTDIDPPAVPVVPAPPVTTSPNPGGGTITTTGTSTSAPVVVTTATGTVTLGAPPVIISTTTGSTPSSPGAPVLTSTVLTSNKPLTAAQKRALLKADEKSVSKLKSSITNDEKLIKTAKGKTLKADEKRLASLNAQLKSLNKKIKQLK